MTMPEDIGKKFTRTALMQRKYEGTHMREMGGTGDTDAGQRGIQDRDNTLYNQCRLQINKLVPPSVVITTAVPQSYKMISSSQRANEDLLNNISSLIHTLKFPDAMEKRKIITKIEFFGLRSVAERLSDLDAPDEDDPEGTPMEVKSLRWFAEFVMGKRLPPPKIGLKPDGLVQAAWFVRDGILSMDFLPSGDIRYAAILQNMKWSASGISPPDRIMKEIEPFERALDR